MILGMLSKDPGSSLANFDRAVEIVFGQEGGFSNDPADPGGATSMGITEQTFEEAKQKGIIPPNVVLKELTKDQAKQIYKAMYWDAVSADAFPWPIALATFDAAVNTGVSRAIAMLQQAVGTRIDGIVGAATIKAAASAPEDALDRMLASRAIHYVDLAVLKPSLLAYRFGWLRRCFTIARLSA